MKLLFRLASVLLLCCLGCAAPRPQPAAVAAWPTEAWTMSTPEEQGLDSTRLAAMLEEVADRHYAIDGIVVVRHGYLVLDAGIGGYDTSDLHEVYSCTKSVVSALVGIAQQQGDLPGLDASLQTLFPQRAIANLDARKQQITLEQLLTMTPGLDTHDNWTYRWRGLDEMRASGDWVQWALDRPVVQAPGRQFEYANSVSHLLSAALTGAVGQPAAAYAEAMLFGPIGVKSFAWDTAPDGVSRGYAGLRLSAQDMARFGYLYLRQGQWADRQLVPAAWVAASTRKHADGNLQPGYGYQWWVDTDGVYMALGYSGQYILVAPEQDLVVVFVSQLEERLFGVPEDLVRRHILADARDGALPADARATRRLAAAQAALAR